MILSLKKFRVVGKREGYIGDDTRVINAVVRVKY